MIQCILAMCLLLTTSLSAYSQGGVVRGTITDSVTGKPLIGAKVAAIKAGRPGRETSDSLGRFVINRLSLGTIDLEFHCPSLTMLGYPIGKRKVEVMSGGNTLDVRVPPNVCTEPPFSERYGIFEGHYEYGFEQSSFIPCPGVLDTIKSLPNFRVSAWVEFSDKLDLEKVKWPPKNDPYYPSTFVRWCGKLSGPGMYGHMNVSKYEMLVDSILTMRLPRK